MGNSPVTNRINALLAEKGIAKQDFYEGCGISSASYSLWNTGKTFPKRKSLEKVASFLNTSVDYLLTGLGEKEKKPTINEGELTKKEKYDIATEVEKILEELENSGDLMFDGDPASPEAVQSIKNALQIGLTYVRTEQKKKGENR